MSSRPKKKAPAREGDAAGRLIAASSALSTAVVLFHGAVASSLGLHGTDHKTLALLREHGPMPAGRLGTLTGLSSGAVTALVDRLERGGYVRRVRDEGDRRKQLVELVPESLATMAPAFASIARETTKMARQYDEAELELIIGFLDASTEMLRREATKLGAGG